MEQRLKELQKEMGIHRNPKNYKELLEQAAMRDKSYRCYLKGKKVEE